MTGLPASRIYSRDNARMRSNRARPRMTLLRSILAQGRGMVSTDCDAGFEGTTA